MLEGSFKSDCISYKKPKKTYGSQSYHTDYPHVKKIWKIQKKKGENVMLTDFQNCTGIKPPNVTRTTPPLRKRDRPDSILAMKSCVMWK